MAQSVWNVGNGSWGTAGNWAPAALPVSDPSLHLIFNAAGSTVFTTTHNLGAMTLNRLTINSTSNGTLVLAGATAADTLTFAGTAPALDITGSLRFTGRMTGSAVITKTGSGTFIHDSDNSEFTGSLIIDGGTFANWGSTTTPNPNGVTNFNPTSIVVNNGGTYQFGNLSTGDPNLPLTTYITLNSGGVVSWQETQVFGGVHLQGGTIELIAGNLTGSGTVAQSWTHGTVTGISSFVINGTAPINKTTGGTVTLTGNASIGTTGGLKILEGAVVMTNAINLGTAPITFGTDSAPATLEYRGASASRAGNIIRNAGGGLVQVTEASTILTLTGTTSGTGSLTKTGPGTLHLAGALSATGNTLAANGTLRVNPVSASSNFVVNPGAILAVNNGAGTASFSVPKLTLDDGTSTLLMELNSATVPTLPLVVVRTSNSLLFSREPTLRVTNAQPFANGTYTLLDYSGTAITSGFNLKLPGRTTGGLIYDAVNTRIQMSITGTDTIKWTGAINGIWDAGSAVDVGGTSNWQLVAGGTATNFIDTDTVRFDDAATAFDVDLAGTVRPFAVVVDAASDYSIAGSGKISGTTGLTKTGAGKLTLAGNHDYSGGTVVSGGSLQLGNGGAGGSVTGFVTLNSSTLIFNHSDDFAYNNATTFTGNISLLQNGTGEVTINTRLAAGASNIEIGGSGTMNVTGAITGTGIFNKNGSGRLNLLGPGTFSGTLNINGGSVQLTDNGFSGDLSPVSIVINDGGSFIFGPDGNPDLPSATFITVNAGGLLEMRTGESYGGIILNGGEYRVTTSANANVSSTADTAVAGSTGYDLRSGTITTDISGTGSGGMLNQSGGALLIKSTPGTVTINGGVTFASSLAIHLREGVLAMNTANVPTSGGAGVGIVLGGPSSSGTLQINGGGTVSSSRELALADGGGEVKIVEAGTILRFTGAVTGSGTLSKTGSGTLELLGSLGSTGTTTVSGGTLRLKAGAMAGGLSVSSAAVLAVKNDAGTVPLSAPALALADGAILRLELATPTIPALPLVVVTGTDGLTHAGNVTLGLTNSQNFASGLYKLLDYSGAAIAAGFTLQTEGRVKGVLNYDTVNTQITANITTGEIRWSGASNGNWDSGSAIDVGGTPNWLTASSTATNFIQTDYVRFDDGATSNAVNLVDIMQPNGITVNASTDFIFSGSGKISGTATLSKAGSGRLILATNNDYTGGTTISAGLLQLGDGGTSGSLTGPVMLSGGSLGFNRSGSVTFANAITITASSSVAQNGVGAVTVSSGLALGGNTLTVTGSGDLTLSGVLSGSATDALVMNGSGTLYLPATNTFTGNTVINSGIVSLAAARGLGATTADVLINGGTLRLTASNLGSVVSTSRTVTIGGRGGVLDFEVDQTFQGNGFAGTGNVTKTGGGVWTVSSNASAYSGAIMIAEGGLRMTSAQLNGAASIAVGSGAQFIIDDDANGTWSLAPGGKFTLSGDGGGAGVLRQINSNAGTAGNVFTTTFNREVVLNAGVTIATEVASGTILISANVTGAGSLTKLGPGVLNLSGTANTYQGGTLVSQGTLLVTNAAGSGTGSGSVTVGSSGKLQGTGIIAGNTTLRAGAIVQAGTSSTRGTLTFAGETTLSSGSYADFRLGANGGNDRLVFETLTLGTTASLRVMLGYAPQAGDSFNLMDWASLGAGSDTHFADNLDLSGAVLGSQLLWDTSLFDTLGVLSVVAVPEPSRLVLLSLGLIPLLFRRRIREG